MYKGLALIFLCLCSYWIQAQSESNDKNGFEFPNGFRFGFQSSNLHQDGSSIGDHLSRGYVGYLRKVHLVPFLHLETGLEYMIAGSQQNSDSKLELHYLTVPAQGVFKIGPFVALGGINANFRVAENYTVNGEKVKRKGDERSNAFDLALDAGGGFNFLAFTAEFRYYWGLLEVDNGAFNRYWQAGLKIHF